MMLSQPADKILQEIVTLAGGREAVRAILLTSTRAVPGGRVDELSDYDVVLIVEDIHPFVDDPSWLEDFGEVMVAYWDPVYTDPDFGTERCGNVVQYCHGLKIDFSLHPVTWIERLAGARELPTEYDAGYRVLLDKDGLTEGMPPPTYRAFIPTPPTYAAYLKSINDFLSDAPYVAKFLWRGEVIPAKWCLENGMRHLHLVPMLEWWVETHHDWSLKLGVIGRGLKKYLPSDLWAEVERTYAGASPEDNWEALVHMLGLFRQVSIQVGEALGYAYPEEMHQKVLSYIEHIHQMPPGDADKPAA